MPQPLGPGERSGAGREEERGVGRAAEGLDTAGPEGPSSLRWRGRPGRPVRQRETDPNPREKNVSATVYYLLVTLLLVVLIGGMAVGLALGGRLDELDD